jgi:hypothetical protein
MARRRTTIEHPFAAMRRAVAAHRSIGEETPADEMGPDAGASSPEAEPDKRRRREQRRDERGHFA